MWSQRFFHFISHHYYNSDTILRLDQKREKMSDAKQPSIFDSTNATTLTSLQFRLGMLTDLLDGIFKNSYERSDNDFKILLGNTSMVLEHMLLYGSLKRPLEELESILLNGLRILGINPSDFLNNTSTLQVYSKLKPDDKIILAHLYFLLGKCIELLDLHTSQSNLEQKTSPTLKSQSTKCLRIARILNETLVEELEKKWQELLIAAKTVNENSINDQINLLLHQAAYLAEQANQATEPEKAQELYDEAIEIYNQIFHDFLPQVPDNDKKLISELEIRMAECYSAAADEYEKTDDEGIAAEYRRLANELNNKVKERFSAIPSLRLLYGAVVMQDADALAEKLIIHQFRTKLRKHNAINRALETTEEKDTKTETQTATEQPKQDEAALNRKQASSDEEKKKEIIMSHAQEKTPMQFLKEIQKLIIKIWQHAELPPLQILDNKRTFIETFSKILTLNEYDRILFNQVADDLLELLKPVLQIMHRTNEVKAELEQKIRTVDDDADRRIDAEIAKLRKSERDMREAFRKKEEALTNQANEEKKKAEQKDWEQAALLQDLREKQIQLEQQIKDYNLARQQLEKEISDSREIAAELQDKLEQEQTAVRKLKTELATQTEELRKQSEQIPARIENARKKMEKREEEKNKKLHARITELQQELKEKKAEITQLQKSLTAAQAELETEREQHAQRTKALEIQIQLLNTEKGELRQQLEQLNTKERALQKKLEWMQQNITTLETAHTRENETNSTQLKALREQLATLQNDKRDLTEERDTLTKKVSTLQQELKDLIRQIETEQKTHQATVARQQYLEDQQNMMGDLQNQLQIMGANLVAEQQKVTALRNFQQQIVTTEVARFSTELRQQLHESQQQLKDTQAALLNSVAELERLKDINSDLSRRITLLKQGQTEISDENWKLTKQRNQLEEQIKVLTGQNQKLEEELKKLQTQPEERTIRSGSQT